MLQLVVVAVLLCSIRSNCNNCNLHGTIGNTLTCLKESECHCKPSIEPQSSCSTCFPQFHNISAINVFGCQRCSCDVGGSYSQVCNEITGECGCKEGVVGRDCDRPDQGRYVPSLYHLKGNVLLGDSISALKGGKGAKIRGVIEPQDMGDVPSRFKLLFDEYPVPISFSSTWKQSKPETRKKVNKNKTVRSLQNTAPISKHFSKDRVKRQSKMTHKTSIRFPKPGTYFLVMNYTASTESDVQINMGRVNIPTLLPSCQTCLILIAGSLGIKGVEVTQSGVQNITFISPSHVIIDSVIALPKQFYFTTALKQDVSPRCNIGPFTELCNWYKYPVDSPHYKVEQAESWLSPSSSPAYTLMTGINLFGISSNQFHDFTSPTNKLKLKALLKEGKRYYIIVKYFKPYHYTNFAGMYSVDLTVQSGNGPKQQGKVDFIPCPWLDGCRSVSTNEEKVLKLFDISKPLTKVTISIEENFMVFIDSVMFIEDTQWELDLIQAQFYCVQGPDGDCLQSDFIELSDYVFYESESAIDAKKLNLEDTFYHGTGVMLLDNNNPSLSVVLLENIILSSLKEEYVLIVHYTKYTAGDTKGAVNIYDENDSQGDVIYKFCPSASGCRVAATVPGHIRQGVVTHNPSWTGYYSPLPVTGGNVHIIVRLSLVQPDSIYVDFLSLVPLSDFTVDMLFPLPLDHGPIFTQYCACNNHLYLNPRPDMKQYCENLVFSMSTLFYNKTLSCGCSREGSQSTTCDQITQECRCKPGYTGTRCDQCDEGFYGYPNCTDCGCDIENSYSNKCNETTGQCSCAPNFSGEKCTECAEGRYGYNTELKLTCHETCNCDLYGSSNVSCHVSTGQCRCKERVAGRRCDTCEAGSYRFPACYPCQCNERGVVDLQCHQFTGNCSCKEGYVGEQCHECADYHYYNGTDCTPCTCSGANTTCTSTVLYPYQVMDDMSNGYEGYYMTDMNGSSRIDSRLSLLYFDDEDKEALMVDLSRPNDNTFLRLPPKFLGEKGGDIFQIFSYKLDILTGEAVSIASDTIFQGLSVTLRYRNEYNLTGSNTKVNIEVPLYMSSNSRPGWSILSSDEQPSDKDIQEVLSDLVDIRIQAKVFETQIVALVDNIKLEYLTRTPNTTPPRYIPVCDCGIGYTGNQCQFCDGAFYRNTTSGKCDIPCPCHAKSCSETGVCQECTEHRTGETCEGCQEGFYRSDADTCLPCGCSLGGATSVIPCTVKDNKVVCARCELGYTGSRCQMCENGYYGDPVFNKQCVPCPCNNNLNLTVPDACHPLTGSCRVCTDSTAGKECEECAVGYYGDTCKSCDCWEAGSVTQQCDRGGRCRCKGDVTGDKCDQCWPGQYVKKHMCGGCQCSPLTSKSGVCDTRTGQCDCDTGYGGRRCDTCDTGFYLDTVTSKCQDCECSEYGTKDGICNTLGMCECMPGYHGISCSECSGYHVNNNDGSCQVCGDCPVTLLQRIRAINATVDLQKGNALVSDYEEKFDRLRKRAYDIQDSLPETPNTDALLRLADKVKEKSKRNRAHAQELIPQSQKVFADVSDAERAAGDVPDTLSEQEDKLRDIINNIKNFNLSPRINTDALSKAKKLIAEMKKEDPKHILKNATDTQTDAEAVNDAAIRLSPTAPQIPDLAPIPLRLRNIQQYLANFPLDNVTRSLSDLGPAIDQIRGKEVEAAKLSDKAGDMITQLRKTIPMLQGANQKSQNILDNLQVPDTKPLKNLVKNQREALAELTPLVKPRLFNCSRLGLRNLTADDSGPKFIRDMAEHTKHLEKLKALVREVQNSAAEAEREANDFEETVDDATDRGSFAEYNAKQASRNATSMENLIDLAGGDLDNQETYNKGNRTKLDNLQIPSLPTHSVNSVPDSVIDKPDIDQLADRISNLQSVPEIFDVTTELPKLINETEAAVQLKDKITDEFNNIDFKLRSLRDKIEKAKRSVETILIPMRFTGQDSYAKYKAKVDKAAYLSVEATFTVEENKAYGGILYLGPELDTSKKRDVAGDYVEIGLEAGVVVSNVNIDNNVVRISSDADIIQPNSWNTVSFVRKGGYVSLKVNENEITKEVHTTSTLNFNNLVIGRSKTHISLKGSVSDVNINNHRVSQWLTDNLSNVNKSVRANRVIRGDKDIYYFNGDTSYLAYRTPNTAPYDIRTASMSIRTASKDGLIMFYANGQGKDLDVFAIDLHEGDLRFHYSSNGELITESVPPKKGEFSDLSDVKISTYITSKSGGRMGVSSSRGTKKGRTAGSLNLMKQIKSSYIGKVPDDLLEKYSSLFEDDRISSKGFIGCISEIKLNKQFTLSLQTARYIKNGCSEKLVSSVSIQKDGVATLRHMPLGDISLVIATAASYGSLLYAGNDQDQFISLTLDRGTLRVQLMQGGKMYTVHSNAAINTSSKRAVRVVTTDNRLSLYIDDIAEDSVALDTALFALSSSSYIYLGKLPSYLPVATTTGYTGCINYLVIQDKIIDFAFDAVDKSNVILDRCRVIKEIEGPSEGSAEEVVSMLQSDTCRAVQSNTLPNSMYFSSTASLTNHVQLRVRSNSIIMIFTASLKLATRSSSGALIYMTSADGKTILLTFVNDAVVLTVNFGDNQQMEVSNAVRVNDGYTHKIAISRKVNTFSVTVDGRTKTDSFRGRVVQFMLKDYIYVGGVPESIYKLQSGFTKEFSGCISSISLGNQQFDSASPMVRVIGHVPLCVGNKISSSSHYFNGSVHIIPDVSLGITDDLKITFRSSRQTGDIISLLDDQDNSIVRIALDNDKLLISRGGKDWEIPVEGPMYFCDGTYHSVFLKRDSSLLTIQVDGGNKVTIDMGRNDKLRLLLGDQFTGCMNTPSLNGAETPMATPLVNSGVQLHACPNQTF